MSCTNQGEMYLRYWRKCLDLEDWHIRLDDECDISDMDIETVGQTTWQEVSKTARIQIIDPVHYGERVIPFDYEKTLVHELLHLKTCLLTDNVDPLQERVGHILIDDLARALVDAKRSEAERYDGT